MKLTIKKIGINGEGIAYFKRKPVFILNAFVDEIVECDLIDKGTYYIGNLKKIYKESKYRINSACIYQNKCSACQLIKIAYEKQLQFKKELLLEALYKYARYEKDIVDIIASDDIYHYRNKANMPIVEYNNKLSNALYEINSNKPIIIDECIIHDKTVEKVRIAILDILNKYQAKAYDKTNKTGYRQLLVRSLDNNTQIILVTGQNKIDEKIVEDIAKLKTVKSIYQIINTSKNIVNILQGESKLLYGDKKITFKLNNINLSLSPYAFFQLNYKQAKNIYDEVRSLIKNKANLIVEAYCGIGAISLNIADKANKIIGIEINKDAIKDGKDNCKLNNINNIEFICDDSGKRLNKIVKDNNVDVLIVDPPRSGLEQNLLKCLLTNNIKQIVYVSCNPATLAKDLSYLFKKYEISSIKAFDMFPNTPLVETVVNLYQISPKK